MAHSERGWRCATAMSESSPTSFPARRRRKCSAASAPGRWSAATCPRFSEDDVFDAVCAFEVLEHIEDDAGALRAWRERLRPDGRLLMSVPLYQRRYAAADRFVGHFRRYDPEPLGELLRETGYADVKLL